jgi:hypothetical protein
MKTFTGKILTKQLFDKPIFIVGASRSGTSVLLQALGKHPAILSMPGEAPFITSMGGSTYLFEFDKSKNYYLESIKVSKEYLYDSFRRMAFEVAAGANYGIRSIAKNILHGDLSTLLKRFWCAKTFPTYNVGKGLVRLYPKVKFIYIVRNGFEVVHSRTKFHGFNKKSFDEHCKEWASTTERFRYLLTFERAITIRHEQLVTEPEIVFQNVFSFIGIRNHIESAHFVRNTLVHPLDKSTQTEVNVEKLLTERKTVFLSWSDEQRQLFRKICGNAMQALGYEMPF